MNNDLISFIREQFSCEKGFIPLHEPRFVGNEKKYLNDAIDSTFVSSVGKYVNDFEKLICDITGSKFAVATCNGTNALHIALLVSGVNPGDEVLTQPLTFVATPNSISYTGAKCVFLDVDSSTMGLSHNSLISFLEKNTFRKNGFTFNKKTKNRISACVPMHSFGFPCEIEKIVEICKIYNIRVIEDAAESLGSLYKQKHTGTFGDLGVYSFNGNKIVTSGGGGVIVTDNQDYANLAKHLTTTAKEPHPWLYNHDMIGYNFRMPNLNAALLCAQIENLEDFIKSKRDLAEKYFNFFSNHPYDFIKEPDKTRSNYWLMCILTKDKKERDKFLNYTNGKNIMTRPAWTLVNKLKMYKDCESFEINNATNIESRLVNIPSSVRL